MVGAAPGVAPVAEELPGRHASELHERRICVERGGVGRPHVAEHALLRDQEPRRQPQGDHERRDEPGRHPPSLTPQRQQQQGGVREAEVQRGRQVGQHQAGPCDGEVPRHASVGEHAPGAREDEREPHERPRLGQRAADEHIDEPVRERDVERRGDNRRQPVARDHDAHEVHRPTRQHHREKQRQVHPSHEITRHERDQRRDEVRNRWVEGRKGRARPAHRARQQLRHPVAVAELGQVLVRSEVEVETFVRRQRIAPRTAWSRGSRRRPR